MAKRTPLSKSKRFAIFARDQYCCRYCGASPPDATLVVDHIIPVSGGGGNDDTNLITSCRSCNAGKGKKRLTTVAPTDSDKARIAQEYVEQIEIAKLAKKAAKARKDIRQACISAYCESVGVEEVSRRFVSFMANCVVDFGMDAVCGWLDVTVGAVGVYENDVQRYFCGIVRHERQYEDQGDNDAQE